MRDVNQRQTQSNSSPLSEWLHQVIAEPEVRLRIRLRGDILHLLCESPTPPQQAVLMSRLTQALSSQVEKTRSLTQRAKDPIEKIMVYGRAFGHSQAAWVEVVELLQLPLDPSPQSEQPASGPTQLASNESLARMGSTEAIARHLSDLFSHLGISIKTLVQQLPDSPKSARKGEPTANKRLWVVCNCDYSPEAELLAEPLAQKLRDLQLSGFRDAVIRAQVSGETTPEWSLQVDLTHPDVMLRQWARWGDPEAIAQLLCRALDPHGLQAQAVLKDSTLHVFCSLLPARPKEALASTLAKEAIAPLLEDIAPQGITAAALYGVEGPKFSLDLPEHPIWVDWLQLPASRRQSLALSPTAVARQNRLDALTFLFQRALNPDLETRLATGGIRVKLCYRDRLLHILVEGLVCPAQGQVVPPIEAMLRDLLISDIASARIYGRRGGQSSPAWKVQLDLLSLSSGAAKTSNATPFPSEKATLENAVLGTETAIAPPSQPADSPLRQAARSMLGDLANGLAKSQLFVPIEQTDSLSAALSGESAGGTSPVWMARELKKVALWGGLGLLLAVPIDWLLAWTVTTFPPLENESVALPASQETESDVPGEVSEVGDGFNGEGFTGSRVENEAATAAILATARSENPSFNNQLLDEKLALYQERIRTSGVPDVLIVGSSRAMRGIDPATLQRAIAQQSDRELEVFNFGINGATAKVVELILRQVLTPEQLPKLIIWADGARAFNSGRPDRTYEAIASSAGYQRLQAGDFPGMEREPRSRPGTFRETSLNWQRMGQTLTNAYQSVDGGLNQTLASLSRAYRKREELKDWLRSRPLEGLLGPSLEDEISPDVREVADVREAIDLDGFLPLGVRFDPETYYTSHPRVAGAYDSDYDSFNIEGEQYEALAELTDYLKQYQIELVFVNLPLTNDYLDPVRRQHEEEFVEHMQQAAIEHGLIFRDLGQTWLTEYDLFSDPSHLNRYGADRVSLYLARDSMIPWN
ncbi:MAG: DUF1574 domain-containing protein [Cyanobacteriota bacterium]|nr:DUF1574 domain-containing protein [Cyanobacteriota bacterium]